VSTLGSGKTHPSKRNPWLLFTHCGGKEHSSVSSRELLAADVWVRLDKGDRVMTNNKQEAGRDARDWLKPELKRLDAGSADALGSGRPDGSREPGTALS
jgi:hypothetical protein